ncbi:MAG: DUF3883 domain-containing protein, partial [Methanosarcina mazei]
NVKPNTVKNWRDEFDPLHENKRRGWYQRELRPSRLNVVDIYKDISEDAFTQIVNEILSPRSGENYKKYTEVIDDSENDKKDSSARDYTSPGITGKKAEEIFQEKFKHGDIGGFSGVLTDTRTDGCGYDFRLNSSPFVFEIKGLSGPAGGIRFTDKEWDTAKKLREHYILVLVSNIEEVPVIKIIADPYSKLNAQKQVYTTIAIDWHIDSSQLVLLPE